ncbi:MAG: hypothetical protein R6U91_06060 [Bacillota bacterium]
MLTKRLLAISLTVILIFSLAAPAFASSNYQRFFDVDGDISMKMQAGSDYSEAGKHQTIAEGVGRLERYDFIRMGDGKLDLENMSDWKAEQDSLHGLEVASSFWLNEDYDEESNAATLVYDEESEQVFAVSIDAERGEEGQLSQDISSGDSFEIEQKAGTDDGTLKRYIDLVEPESGEYLYEDTEIKGYAVVVDQLGPNDDQSEEVEVFQFSNPDSEGEAEEAKKDQDSEDTNEDIMEAEQKEEPRDSLLKLAGEEIFEKEVPLGTEVEDIGLPETIELTTELFKITGIAIEWEPKLIEDYDPDVEGPYVFIGKLIFPENVVVPETVIIDFTVTVTDEEEQKEIDSAGEEKDADNDSGEKDDQAETDEEDKENDKNEDEDKNKDEADQE